MNSNTAPKVGDAVTTYDQLKALPDGTVLGYAWDLDDTTLRFVQHDGHLVNVLDNEGDLFIRVNQKRTYIGTSYIVKSIPETTRSSKLLTDWLVSFNVE